MTFLAGIDKRQALLGAREGKQYRRSEVGEIGGGKKRNDLPSKSINTDTSFAERYTISAAVAHILEHNCVVKLPIVQFSGELNSILVGGGQICPPSLVDFFSNPARKKFIAMKLLDFLQLLIVQLLKKFH